jgi:polyprenyldihydroxybenzoate methyltransferase/3-demethylubiquinol 3-O-methyltransferase
VKPETIKIKEETIESSGSDSSKKRSTIDSREVSNFATNFDYDTWWKSREGAPLRAFNQIRVPLVRDNLVNGSITTAKPLIGLRILEIGSGGGVLCEPLARLGADMIGLDPVRQNIETSERHLEETANELKTNLKYICSTIEEYSDLTINHNKFDAVVASEVLEHVDDVSLFLESSHKVLKSGGKLFITTINQTTSAYLLGILAAENLLNLVPKGTHSYDKLVPLNGLILLLRELQFDVDIVQGACFNPLTGNWSWTSSTAINYAIVASKK